MANQAFQAVILSTRSPEPGQPASALSYGTMRTCCVTYLTIVFACLIVAIVFWAYARREFTQAELAWNTSFGEPFAGDGNRQQRIRNRNAVQNNKRTNDINSKPSGNVVDVSKHLDSGLGTTGARG